MTLPIRSSGSFLAEEFHCRGCGGHDAYRSRPRGFFERYLLPLVFLRPVRCDRCYLRSYVWRTVSARERTLPGRKQLESQPLPPSNRDSRIA